MRKPSAPLRRATLETLEQRRLLAFTGGNYVLPFLNDFTGNVTGIEDNDGQNVGFPIVQGNDAGDEYAPALIDLDTSPGVLRLTSRGDADSGGNFGTDNSLANGLQLPFDAAAGPWTIHTRVSGENLEAGSLLEYNQAFEQAGILFGPTQDNFVKLVFGHDGINRIVQFVYETTNAQGEVLHPAGADGFKSTVAGVQGVDLPTARFVDLWLSGDPATNEVTAQYRVEGGQTVRFDETIQLTDTYFRADGARAGVMVQHKNDVGPITAAFDLFEVTRQGIPTDRPAVDEARPGPDETDVDRDAFVAVDLVLPNAGVDESTLSNSTVKLFRTSDNLQVPARVNTTGGGDAIILQPLRALDAQTEYRFEITSGVTDLFGVPFVPYTQTFTTGYGISATAHDVAFDQVDLPSTAGSLWSSVTVGPDNKLYATDVMGVIKRWTIAGDGSLSSPETISSLTDAEGGPRVVTGLTFAPDATADNLVAYVTHTYFNDVTTDNPSELGEDFSGKVTKLSGPNLGTVQDVVTGLPRSIRDHLTNQPTFGPDGRLYVPQGANTAMGEPDAAWGFREEHLLNAAILAIDVDAIGTGTVDATTADGGGDYDPQAAGAPVTLYATGVRNAYDLVWHSSGHLFAPTNGSAAGGNTPASPQPDSAEFGDDRVDLDINGPFSGEFVPGLDNVQQTQNDYLFRIEEGGYYGAPNPARDEWVMNGGNPTSGDDLAEVPAYPIGTDPDRNYRGFAFDFGKNYSPNGAIEYTGDTFGGELSGKLLITRYSGGDDLLVLDVDANGNVVDQTTGIAGFTGFDDPLDVAQGADGTLYVAEFGGQKITLLKPVQAGGEAAVRSRRIFTNSAPGEVSKPARFTVRNDGGEPLVVSGYTLGITGPDKDLFRYAEGTPTGAVSIAPGASHDFEVEFLPPADAVPGDTYEAMAFVQTSDAQAPEVGSRVIGMVTEGSFDANEPSLQYILDAYGFGIDTGDDDPTNNAITPGGDLVEAPLFRVADPAQPVVAVPIASFGPATDPAATVGYYQQGLETSRQLLHRIEGVQRLDPEFHGAVKFGVGDEFNEVFGLWMQTPTFLDDGLERTVYSEPHLNQWEPNASERQKTFAYPATLADGTVLPNTYVVTFEEFENATDANDVVLILRNVEPVAYDGPAIQVVNPFEVPFSDRLTFSTIEPGGREAGQAVRDTLPLTIRNVGTEAISLTGLTTNGEFTTSGFTPGTEIAPGASTTFNVNFTASADDVSSETLNAVYQGSLVITNDDPNLPSTSVELAGLWQRYSEDGRNVGINPPVDGEPTLNQLMDVWGIDTNVGTPAQRDNNGIIEAVGEEVLSPFWKASGTDTVVEVYQLVALHLYPVEEVFAWYPQGDTGASQTVFTHEGAYAQSMLPAINGGSGLAMGSFEPGDTPFGIRVSGEFSDPAENFNSESDQGHHFRFFPLRDREGDLVEDSWLVTMDFAGFNFDYNDNVFIIHGMEPAELPAAPVGLGGARTPAGEVVIDWGRPEGAAVDGFRVYRSTDDRQSFQLISDGTMTADFFIDDSPEAEETFYRVYSIDGNETGMFSDVRIA